jgi:hypothetical protein
MPSLMSPYLAANVVYASLFKKSPVGNGYTAGLDPSVAKHMQTDMGYSEGFFQDSMNCFRLQTICR